MAKHHVEGGAHVSSRSFCAGEVGQVARDGGYVEEMALGLEEGQCYKIRKILLILFILELMILSWTFCLLEHTGCLACLQHYLVLSNSYPTLVDLVKPLRKYLLSHMRV